MNDKSDMCCKKFSKLIDKRLDGDITLEEDVLLDIHLEKCTSCAEELAAFDRIEILLNETIEDPIDVPDGFFERLEVQLEDVKPAKGIMSLFGNPIFSLNIYRGPALAIASFLIFGILTVGVVQGFKDRTIDNSVQNPGALETGALILTNTGDTIAVSGDEGDVDVYNDTLEDLQKAYNEGLDDSNAGSDGYVHTSWDRDGSSGVTN